MKFPKTKKDRDVMAKESELRLRAKLGDDWRVEVNRKKAGFDRFAIKSGTPGADLVTTELRRACERDYLDLADMGLMVLRLYLGEME